MNRTLIDWADYAWNPVTGCLHTCPYCYARRQSARFAGDVRLNLSDPRCERYLDQEGLYVLHEPYITRENRSISYPFGFAPTLHEYRLYEKSGPALVKNGVNFFVGSMTDLFGGWVPAAWIGHVFETCKMYPQHNYMFLTKNPERYRKLSIAGHLPELPNMWFGTSITDPSMAAFHSAAHNTFLSIEPILAPFPDFVVNLGVPLPGWVIIGAETGRRKDKVVPERKWIQDIAKDCRAHGIPVFMKESLAELLGDDFVQEYPPRLMYKRPSPVQKKQLWEKCSLCKTEFRKKDMIALLAREKRGASAVKLGYACPICFKGLQASLSAEKPCACAIREDSNEIIR